MSLKITRILDEAAKRIEARLQHKVQRRSVSTPDEGESPPSYAGIRFAIALSEGQGSAETGFRMGAAEPFDMEHRARLEILAVEGDRLTRTEECDALFDEAEAAITEDPTLGGLCDYAEFEGAIPDDADEAFGIAAQAGWACDLVILYASPSARG